MQIRILVVDDEKETGDYLQLLLTKAGYEVVALTDPTQVMDRLRAEDFHLVILDMMMPQMSGTELHQRVAAGHPDLARRMIFITGGAFTAGAAGALAGLPNPCVTKPFQAAQLKAALERVAAGAPGPAS